MIAGVLLATLQSGAWAAIPAEVTVGDTVLLVRQVVAAPEVRTRLEPLAASPVIQPLSGPRASYAEGALVIRYAIAMFATGTHTIEMPEAELLYPDGRSEVLMADSVVVIVRSVLPADTVAPKALLDPLPVQRRRKLPLATLLLGVIAGSATWGGLRRRRRRRRDTRPAPSQDSVAPPIDRWISAGESRAVVTYVAERIRGAIGAWIPPAGRHLDTEACLAVLERERPDWPHRDIREVLKSLDRARFAPAVSGDVTDVIDRAEVLLSELDRLSQEESS